MALDIDLRIDHSVTIDISASATPTPGAGLLLGRRGIVAGSYGVIHIEDVSADTSIDPVIFDFEITVDGGTVWQRIASIVLSADGAMAHKGPFSVPLGGIDLRDEIQGVNDLKIRVKVTLAATGSTDDFTFSSYITGANPYPQNNQVGFLP